MAVQVPPPDLIARFPGIFALLLGAAVSGQLTRWWSSVADNARVGGDPDSQHLIGWAIDIVPANKARAAEQLRARGLTVIDEGDHLHAQIARAGQVSFLVRQLRR